MPENERMTDSDPNQSGTDPGMDIPVVLVVITNWLNGQRALNLASATAPEFTMLLEGKGTVRTAVLRQAGLSDLRKEIAVIGTSHGKAEELLELLRNEMQLEEPHAGIAFLLRRNMGDDPVELKSDQPIRFQAVAVLVSRGFAENVIMAGEKAGTRGATVIRAEGRRRAGSVPGLWVHDDEELILILTTREKLEGLIREIRSDREILAGGRGGVYVVDVLKTAGISYY